MQIMTSGIKPTGKITLGNYLGAIKNFIEYQDKYNLNVFIADLHALTIYSSAEELNQNIKDLIKIYIACGLDINKVKLFRQSKIYAHNQLEWILTCNTDLSDLTKMPQYKNYCEKHKNEAIPTGMLLYPSLMNADILLYDTELVPVGEDQKPHVDLTRDIAEKFNKLYGQTFILPKALVPKQGAKIMSLSDPTKKMSKSESDKGTIYLLDDIDISIKKIKKATTDSEFKIYYNKETKPGISNLLIILSCLSNKSIEELEDYYKNETNYGIFKKDICDCVYDEINKIQTNIKNIDTIDLTEIENKMNEIANKKIETVYKKIGLWDV